MSNHLVTESNTARYSGSSSLVGKHGEFQASQGYIVRPCLKRGRGREEGRKGRREGGKEGKENTFQTHKCLKGRRVAKAIPVLGRL